MVIPFFFSKYEYDSLKCIIIILIGGKKVGINILLFLIFIVLLLNFLLNLRNSFPEFLSFKKLYLTSYICIFNIILAILIQIFGNKVYRYGLNQKTKEEIYLIIIYSIVYFFLNNRFKTLNYTIIYILIMPYFLLNSYTQNVVDMTGILIIILMLIGILYTFYQIIRYEEIRKQLVISLIIFLLTILVTILFN